jgi:hypothetical protein
VTLKTRSRRAVVTAIGLLFAGLGPTAAAASPGHRLTDSECAALEGHTLDASPRLRDDLARLVGDRFPRFLEGLSDRRPIERIDADLIGEGVRPGSLGTIGSFFVVGRDGALFVALKSGLHGEQIETFGDVARLSRASHHRYFEFADLDE